MVHRMPWLAVILFAAGSLLPAAVSAAQTLRKTNTLCAGSCPPPDHTTKTSETGPHLKVVIDDVIFDGPMPPPDSRTAQVVIDEIKHHRCVNPGWLNEILEVPVQNAWLEDGYNRALIRGKSQVVFEDAEFQHVVITIHVDPGPQYWLGNVSFRTSDPNQPLVFSPGDLRPLIALQDGDVFNFTKMYEGYDAIRRLYNENGYIDFNTTPFTTLNDSTQRATLMLELEQGKQFRISKVDVLGLDPKNESALNARLTGAVFKRSEVNDAVKAALPGLSDDDLNHLLALRRNEKEATVAVVVDFRQ
jgi:outer membrane protein assembly factor BamA